MPRYRVWHELLGRGRRRRAPAPPPPPPRKPPARAGLWDWLGLICGVLAFVAVAVLIGVGMARGATKAPACKPPAIPEPAAVIRLQAGAVLQLARVAWGEARGEPEPFCSMLAVSWVVINRVRTDPKQYGATVEQVVTAPYQFSVFGRSDPNRAKMMAAAESDPLFLLAIMAASSALTGASPDPTMGSTHYFNRGMASAPAWARRLERRAVIGAHIFMR